MVVVVAIAIRDNWAESRRERQRQEDVEGAARLKSEIEAARADREDVTKLYGKSVATMGAALVGVALGAKALNMEATTNRLGLATDASVKLDESHGEIARVEITIRAFRDEQGHDRCYELRDALARAWGKPSATSTWLGPSLQRASYVEEKLSAGTDCKLAFDRYLDAAEWVAALPLDGLRNPSSLNISTDTEEVEQVGEHCFSTAWFGTGLGASAWTLYRTDTLDGKIITITVSAYGAGADADDVFAVVRSKLVGRLGIEPEVERGADAGEALRWKRPVVMAQHLGGDFHVILGTNSEQCIPRPKTPWHLVKMASAGRDQRGESTAHGRTPTVAEGIRR